jgi:hypothetical protein
MAASSVLEVDTPAVRAVVTKDRKVLAMESRMHQTPSLQLQPQRPATGQWHSPAPAGGQSSITPPPAVVVPPRKVSREAGHDGAARGQGRWACDRAEQPVADEGEPNKGRALSF